VGHRSGRSGIEVGACVAVGVEVAIEVPVEVAIEVAVEVAIEVEQDQFEWIPNWILVKTQVEQRIRS
jgi:hypothetical protein